MASLRSRCWVANDVVMCSDQSKLHGRRGSCGGGSGCCSVRWRHLVSPPLPKLRFIAASNGVSSSAAAAAVKSDSDYSYSSTMFDRSASVPPAKGVVEEEEVLSGKVDKWIRNSVNEIVNNIEEAPFLVHFYSNRDKGSSPATKLVREKASGDSWPGIKTRWQGGSSSIPNGIALVEELYDQNSLHPKQKQNEDQNADQPQLPCSSSHKVWGIVIQERGVSCPACYILKTTRVRTGVGICTHYCLFRAECFSESVESQLQKLFLV